MRTLVKRTTTRIVWMKVILQPVVTRKNNNEGIVLSTSFFSYKYKLGAIY